MNPSALFSIVKTLARKDSRFQGSQGDFDYESSNKDLDYYEEIKLVDPDGRPCAIPTAQNYRNLDTVHRYADGRKNVNAVLLDHSVNFGIDFINTATRNRLLQIMHNRESVLINPGYGALTEFAWSAANRITEDLTGRNTAVKYVPTPYWFNNFFPGLGFMDTADNVDLPAIAQTPFGAGLVSDPHRDNFISNPKVLGTSAALSGWNPVNSPSLSYNPVGFGHRDCPGSLRVTNDHETQMYYFATGDYPGASGDYGGFVLGVAIKGNVGKNATLRVSVNDGSTTYSSEVDVKENNDSWEWYYVAVNGACNPSSGHITIVLGNPPGSGSHIVDYEIGPRMLCYDSASSPLFGFPTWRDGSATLATSGVRFYPSFPRAGSQFITFYAPDWFRDNIGNYDGYFTLTTHYNGSSGALGQIYVVTENGTNVIKLYVRKGVTQGVKLVTVTNHFRFGGLNCVGLVWKGGRLAVFFNGIMVSDSEEDLGPPATGQPCTIGAGNSSYGCFPLLPTRYRLDREAFDNERAADITLGEVDSGATSVTIPARGRVYRITKVPSTPRPVMGDTHWLGTLGLEQVDYKPYLAERLVSEFTNTL